MRGQGAVGESSAQKIGPPAKDAQRGSLTLETPPTDTVLARRPLSTKLLLGSDPQVPSHQHSWVQVFFFRSGCGSLIGRIVTVAVAGGTQLD